jgi:hypothetical protein
MAPLSLGHTKIEGTVRYPGIEVDDALAIGEQVDVNYQGRADMLCPSASVASGQQASSKQENRQTSRSLTSAHWGCCQLLTTGGQPDS